MALLTLNMTATTHLSHHMTDPHGPSVVAAEATSPVLKSQEPRKPRLSLQTTSLGSTYGSLTRGLGINTNQSAYTPTTANTLTNTWDLTVRPSPISRTESPRPQTLKQQQQPYILTLPFGVRPILKNSPLPRQASISASPRESRRKVFFPKPKQVTFRKILEDTIETKEYTACHVDLSSSSSEAESSSEEGSNDNASKRRRKTLDEYPSPQPSRKRKNSRDLTPSEDVAKQQEDSTLELVTVRSPHCCKRRRWQWTLPTTTDQITDPAARKSLALSSIGSVFSKNDEFTEEPEDVNLDQDSDRDDEIEGTEVDSTEELVESVDQEPQSEKDEEACSCRSCKRNLGGQPDMHLQQISESVDHGSKTICQDLEKDDDSGDR